MLWLIHWDHVASIEHSQEVEVAELTHLSSWGSINSPAFVVLVSEILLVLPFGVKSPSLSTSPVANPIFVSRVDEDFGLSLVENIGNLWHQVGHPVSKEVGVDH